MKLHISYILLYYYLVIVRWLYELKRWLYVSFDKIRVLLTLMTHLGKNGIRMCVFYTSMIQNLARWRSLFLS